MGRGEKIPTGAASCVLAALLALPAHAQAPDEDLETVVATGTRLAAAEPIAAATVLDTVAIELRNAPTVTDLLTGVPGIYAESPGNRGAVGSVFVRGGEANFTPVYIDGVQVNDPTNTRGGSFDFTELDVDEIDRLEVVRGPLSSIYGSDALAGVIQIFTAASTAQALRASFDTGGENVWRASAGGGSAFAADNHFGFVASTEQDGRDEAVGSYRGHALSGAVTLAPRPGTEIAIHARHGESDAYAFPDASGGPLLALLRNQDHRRASDDSVGVALSARRPRGEWEWHVNGTLFEHTEQAASAGIAAGALAGVPASRDDGDFRRDRLAFFASSPADGRWQGAFGLDHERESGTILGSITFAPGFEASTDYDITRATTGAFAEVAARASERLTVSAALRRDDSDTGGARTTGRLAALYRLTAAGTALRASWGQGFKLPSLFSLGHPLVGNPALRPERATALELALESPANTGFEWQLSAFEQRFRDLIDFDFDLFMSVNRARVNVGGVEFASSYARERWKIAVQATALDVDVLGSSEPLNQRPERLATLSGEWRLTPAVQGFVSWRYVGVRYDSSIPTGRQQLGSFARADLSLSWQQTPRLKWSVALDNVLDRRYQTAIGFPDPGRVLRVGARYRTP